MSENIKYRHVQASLFVLTFFLGIVPIVAYVKWLDLGSRWVSCLPLRGLKETFLVFGVLSLISGVASAIASCCMWGTKEKEDLDSTPLVYVVLAAIFNLVCLCVFIIIMVVDTTGSGSPHPAPGRAYLEYSFNHFPPMLRNKVSNPLRWDGIINCISPSDGCLELNQAYPSSHQLFNAPLNPLQSGCCMPPAECGFTFVTPTSWTSPINNTLTNNTQTNNYTNADCAIWSNDINKLCNSCNSCKAGLLAKTRKNVRRTSIVFWVIAAVSFVVHVFSFLLLCVNM